MSIRACHYQASEMKICTPNADGSSLVAQTGKNPPARRETWRGEQHPLQYSSLEKSTGGEAWRARMGAMGSRGVHGVPKNRTWLSDWHGSLSFQDLLSDGVAAKSLLSIGSRPTNAFLLLFFPSFLINSRFLHLLILSLEFFPSASFSLSFSFDSECHPLNGPSLLVH